VRPRSAATARQDQVCAIVGEELGAVAVDLLSGALGVSSYVVDEATRCVEGHAAMEEVSGRDAT